MTYAAVTSGVTSVVTSAVTPSVTSAAVTSVATSAVTSAIMTYAAVTPSVTSAVVTSGVTSAVTLTSVSSSHSESRSALLGDVDSINDQVSIRSISLSRFFLHSFVVLTCIFCSLLYVL